MADLLADTNFPMLDYSPKLNLAALASTRYKELEAMPAWADFMSQIKATREALMAQILTPGGSLDKWGKPHTKEKKALLAFIDTLLQHTALIHRRAEQLIEARRISDEQKARLSGEQTGLLHGGDYIYDSDL